MLEWREVVRVLFSLVLVFHINCKGTSQYRMFGLNIYFDAVNSKGPRVGWGGRLCQTELCQK